MNNVVFSTLSIGDLYETYTRFYIKKLELLSDFKINLCITADRDFSNKIRSKKVECYFNILDDEIVSKTDMARGVNKTTCFKYFYKSYALKFAVNRFPGASICHTDSDIIPNKEFSETRFLSLNKENTLYCHNTVNCAGDYGDPIVKDGEVQNIKPKLKSIMKEFIPDFNDYINIRCPIENILYFNKISTETMIKFCEDWLKFGQFSDKKGHSTYGDCFEIKPACVLNKIEVEDTSILPFCDAFKGKFAELLEQSKFESDEDFLNDLIKKEL